MKHIIKNDAQASPNLTQINTSTSNLAFSVDLVVSIKHKENILVFDQAPILVGDIGWYSQEIKF